MQNINSPNSFVVYLNTENHSRAKLIMIFNICFLLAGLYVSPHLIGFMGSFLVFFLQGLIMLVLILLLIAWLFSEFFVDTSKPALIINKDGIWIRYFEFIYWQDIEIITVYVVPTTRVELIGIDVKNVDKLSKQATLIGKCGIFWSKVFDYYHITIANVNVENDTILEWVRLYKR